jgi:hypothetical protein
MFVEQVVAISNRSPCRPFGVRSPPKAFRRYFVLSVRRRSHLGSLFGHHVPSERVRFVATNPFVPRPQASRLRGIAIEAHRAPPARTSRHQEGSLELGGGPVAAYIHPLPRRRPSHQCRGEQVLESTCGTVVFKVVDCLGARDGARMNSLDFGVQYRSRQRQVRFRSPKTAN